MLSNSTRKELPSRWHRSSSKAAVRVQFPNSSDLHWFLFMFNKVIMSHIWFKVTQGGKNILCNRCNHHHSLPTPLGSYPLSDPGCRSAAISIQPGFQHLTCLCWAPQSTCSKAYSEALSNRNSTLELQMVPLKQLDLKPAAKKCFETCWTRAKGEKDSSKTTKEQPWMFYGVTEASLPCRESLQELQADPPEGALPTSQTGMFTAFFLGEQCKPVADTHLSSQYLLLSLQIFS